MEVADHEIHAQEGCACRIHRRDHRAPAGRGVRDDRGTAAGVRPLLGDRAGDRRGALRFVVAPRVGADDRDLTRRLRVAQSARRGRESRIRVARDHALAPRRGDPAPYGMDETRVARELHLAHGRHRIHCGRGHPHRVQSGEELLRARGAAGELVLRDVDVLLPAPRFDERLCRPRRGRDACRWHHRQDMVQENAVYDSGDPRRELPRILPERTLWCGGDRYQDRRAVAGRPTAVLAPETRF